MSTLLATFLATAVPVPVPDTGSSGILLSLGVLSVGLVARFVKNRKR